MAQTTKIKKEADKLWINFGDLKSGEWFESKDGRLGRRLFEPRDSCYLVEKENIYIREKIPLAEKVLHVLEVEIKYKT